MRIFKSVGFWFLVFFVLAVGFSYAHWWWLTDKWGTDFFMYGENRLTDAWSEGLAYARLNAEVHPMPYLVLAFLGFGWVYSSIVAGVLGLIFFLKLPASFGRWARKNGFGTAITMSVFTFILTPLFLWFVVVAVYQSLDSAFEDSLAWGGVQSVVFGVNEPLVSFVKGEGTLKIYEDGKATAEMRIDILKHDHPNADAEQLLDLFIKKYKFKPGQYGFGRHLGGPFNPT